MFSYCDSYFLATTSTCHLGAGQLSNRSLVQLCPSRTSAVVAGAGVSLTAQRALEISMTEDQFSQIHQVLFNPENKFKPGCVS